MPYFETASESLHLAVSSDGINYADFGKKLYGGVNNNLRDPALFFKGGWWYLAYSPNSFGASQTFYIARSRDLFTWANYANVDFSSVGGVNLRIWSPDWFVDDDGSVHIVVACSPTYNVDIEAFSIYRITATAADLSTWSAPSLIFNEYKAIDPFLIKDGGVYYLWYKNEAAASKYIEVASSATIGGPYTRIKSGNWLGHGSGFEGASVIKRGTGDYLYFADAYAAGNNMRYATSASLLSGWSAQQAIPRARAGAETIRHGTPFLVTDIGAAQGILSSMLSRHMAANSMLITDNTPGFTLNGWRSIGSWSFEAPPTDDVFIMQFIDRSAASNNKMSFAVDGALAIAGFWTGNAAAGNETLRFDTLRKSVNYIRFNGGAGDIITQPDSSQNTVKFEPFVAGGEAIPIRLQNYINDGAAAVSLGFNPTNNNVNLGKITVNRKGETVIGLVDMVFSLWGSGGTATKRLTINGGNTGGEIQLHNNDNATGTEVQLGFRPDIASGTQSLGRIVCRRTSNITGTCEFEFFSWNGSALVSRLKISDAGHIIPSNVPTYANDAAADADATLPSGAFYRTTAGARTVYRKP